MRKGQDTRFLDVFYHRAVPSDPVVDILNSMSDQWTGRRLKRRFLDWADHLHVSQAWFEVWIFGEDTRPTKVEGEPILETVFKHRQLILFRPTATLHV